MRRRPSPAARYLKRKMGWRAGATASRLAPRLPGPRRAPAVANSGWCWRAMPRSMAAIRCRPIPASSSAPRIPPLPAPQALSAPNCCACNSAVRKIASARAKTLKRVVIARDRRRNRPLFPFLAPRMLCQAGGNSLTARPRACAKKSNRNRPTAKAEGIMRGSQRPRARF